MNYRPLRPFFYKSVAILGVPLRDWYITGGTTFASAIFFFFVWRKFYGIEIWFILSLAIGLLTASFFLWSHNSQKKGWLEYSIGYRLRQILGIGQNLNISSSGRNRVVWLKGKTKDFREIVKN